MKFKLILVLQLFLFFMLIATGINAVQSFINFYEIESFDFSSRFQLEVAFSIFKVPLIVLIPLIGLLFRNRFGWILINQYFYFLLFNLVFSAYEDWIYDDWVNDIRYFLIFVFFLVFSLVLIFINSNNKIFVKEFQMDKKRKSQYNLISAIIGFAFSIIFFVLKN
nr:hypothetical protein [uncultured Psychroserpens sp.]